ncbi:MAG: long-chain fatty acid--CoA ligase [Proteobacteria bacterium]|nr:long-chain fatty acid--CoA ligase [Pseudomonadota bacterium]
MNEITLPSLFRRRVRLTPKREAYRQFDEVSREWISYSWQLTAARVARWRAAFRTESLPQGVRIAILVPNSFEHVCIDQAALASGFVPVPLHVVDNPDSLAFVISDCGASVLIVDSVTRWEALVPFLDRFPELRRVVYLTGSADTAPSGPAVPMSDWLVAESQTDTTDIALDPNSLAAIVYTSGTTGRPKGVMLSHRNVVSNVIALLKAMSVDERDVLLSFLPLSHTFERTVGYYLAVASGATVVFARSIPLLAEDLREVRPTVLVSVPRIYERAYGAFTAKLEGHRLSRLLFDRTVKIGWQRFEYRQGRAAAPGWRDRLMWRVLDMLVARRVRARFGGRLRAALCGGAPMAFDIAQPLLSLGVPVLQGYGMTESSPVISCNSLEDNDPTTVGRPLRDVEVRLGDNDELLARDDNVMLGYWHRPDETTRVKEAAGWLHTGDQAEIVDGRIRIKGRIKDIIVTSTGEKISPSDLEAAIGTDGTFEQAMVVGEGRPYLAALLVLNGDRWRLEAESLGVDAQSPQALYATAATQWALARVTSALRGFPSYAMPRRVCLLTEPWTVANGLMTPTLKPKRAAIETRLAGRIAQMYEGH